MKKTMTTILSIVYCVSAQAKESTEIILKNQITENECIFGSIVFAFIFVITLFAFYLAGEKDLGNTE